LDGSDFKIKTALKSEPSNFDQTVQIS
jgi:hypothetical protein